MGITPISVRLGLDTFCDKMKQISWAEVEPSAIVRQVVVVKRSLVSDVAWNRAKIITADNRASPYDLNSIFKLRGMEQ